MPTFKGSYAAFDPRRSPEDNLRELYDRYNENVQRLTQTINNLDEENFGIPLSKIKGDSDNGDE